MKKFAVVIVVAIIALSPSNIYAQNLTVSQWQEDLSFLQETVHKDFPFLFKKVTAQAFDAEVAQLQKELPSLAPHEIPVAFSRIVSMFQYGHTQIPYSALAKDAVLPINLYEFNDGIIIEGAHKDYAKTLGAKVIAIEGVPIQKVLDMIRPVVPVENEQYMKAFGLQFALVPSVLHAQGVLANYKKDIAFTLEKEDRTFETTFSSIPLDKVSIAYNLTVPNDTWISARPQDKTPLHLKHLNERMYYFEYLAEEKTVYARQSNVRNDKEEDLKTFYARMFEFIDAHDVERLVYDVRHNGGGNNFLNTPLITGIIESKKINQEGKFFVITGRRTFSACQNLVNRLDTYTNATFVGEATSENVNFYGDTKPVLLPNSKLTAYLSWAWWQDKAPWENADALFPSLSVTLSSNDYFNNDDPVVDAILNLDLNDFIANPMEHLTQLFIKQDFKNFEKSLFSMVADERYAGINFKSDLNRVVEMLSGRGDYKGATYLREVYTRVFPEDALGWYHLAETIIPSNKISEAKNCLNKAITIDPTSEVAIKAKRLLATLQ